MNIKSKIESLLFIAAKPMGVKQLAGLIKKDGKEIIETFTSLPQVQRVLGAGGTKASIQFAEPELCPDVVQVDLRIVPAESFGAAWQYFTGSKYHNMKLREIAGRRNTN